MPICGLNERMNQFEYFLDRVVDEELNKITPLFWDHQELTFAMIDVPKNSLEFDYINILFEGSRGIHMRLLISKGYKTASSLIDFYTVSSRQESLTQETATESCFSTEQGRILQTTFIFIQRLASNLDMPRKDAMVKEYTSATVLQ